MLEVNMGQVYPKRLSRRQRKAQRADALRLDVRRGASLQMSRAVVFGSAAREPVPLTMPEVRLASISETLSGILPPITERVRPESVEETMRSVGTAVPLSTVFDLSLAPMVPANVWTPRHGGGATLTVGGEVIAEIEPMGGGWWVGVGDGDLVNGTLQEAKVRALEMLSGVSP